MDISLPAFVTVVGLIGASVAALVAVEQLTLPARLRRLEAWARTAAESEDDDARKAVLVRIRSNATARLVAGHHVPAAYLVEGVFWTALGLLILQQSIREPEHASPWILVPFVFVSVATAVRRSIRVYRERQRIAREFAAGMDEIKPPALDMLNQMEGGTRVEFVAALGYALAVCILGTSFGVLQHDNGQGWGVAGLMLGCGGLFAFFLWVRTKGLSRRV